MAASGLAPNLSIVTDHQCRACRGRTGDVVLDLGLQPASDHFPEQSDQAPDQTFPLRMWLCATCGLAQLKDDITVPEEPLGQEPEALVLQASEAVSIVDAAGLVRPGTTFAEYGSPHGGSWLDLLCAKGLEPVAGEGPAQLVIDCFGLMHDADQAAAIRERAHRLSPAGHLLLQFHSLATILREGQWNALRHGHFAYFTTTVLKGMVERAGLSIADAWVFDLYGGTVLLDVSKGASPSSSVAALLASEESLSTSDPAAFVALQDSVDRTASALFSWLLAHQAAGKVVMGYGAASRAVALLHRAGTGPDLLPAIADASRAKWGRRMPGSRIPIVSPKHLIETRPDVVLVFVPDIIDEVRRSLPEVEAWGGRWAMALPEPGLVEETEAT